MNTRCCCSGLFLFLISGLLLVFTGCKDDAAGPSPTGNINVSGKFIDQFNNGIANATISIGDAITTTDVNGSFSINEVTTPYDVKIIAPGNTGIVYKGLTTASPQLNSMGLFGLSNNSTLNVTIPALAANQRATVFFTDENHIQTWSMIFFPATTGSIGISWPGSNSITGKIIVLVYTFPVSHITTYDKYGEKSGFTLNNGGTQSVTFSASELTLNPGESTISGTITVPPGYINPHGLLGLNYLPAASNSLASYIFLDVFLNSTSFSFVVPTGLPTNNQFIVDSYATGSMSPLRTDKAITTTAPTTNASIVLETSSTLVTPPAAATNIDTNTNFTYSAGSGNGIYVLTFLAAGKNFFLITSSTTAKIPNLSSFGLGIGSSLNYIWYVMKYNDITSTDAFVSTPLTYNPSFKSSSISSSRGFTTVP